MCIRDRFKGDKIRGTLVDTALFGANFVLMCDLIGRVVIAPYELPIELIVGIFGSLLFIMLLLYRLKQDVYKRQVLYNKEGKRFVDELLPRDVVTKARCV